MKHGFQKSIVSIGDKVTSQNVTSKTSETIANIERNQIIACSHFQKTKKMCNPTFLHHA